MIISMTPLRISFLGGGTDYPEHFSEFGGATLCTSINKYTYVTVKPLTGFFDYRIRVSYSKTELCWDIDEIQHPSVRECLRFMGIEHGIEVTVVSDLPARTGLGSSSAFTVSLLHALHALKGSVVGREQLAREAVYIEREMIHERVGLQDQYVCACGGLLHLTFREKDKVQIGLVAISTERLKQLEQRLMVFYTGIQRHAHEILESQMERTCTGALTPDLNRLSAMVDEGVALLGGKGPLTAFGELLHEGWERKRSLSDAISSPFIDDIYDRARRAGAIGGKLLGAGGGGFLLMYVEPDKREAVRAALHDLREVEFSMEDGGSRLIFYRR